MEREHQAVDEFGRAGFDPADDRIAVFHREGEHTRHQRRAHALVFARWHAAGEHQALGAAAQRSIERAHPQFARAGRRDRLRANFATARADVPKSTALPRTLGHLPSCDWTSKAPARYIL